MNLTFLSRFSCKARVDYKYSITLEGSKRAKSLDYWQKYDGQFYILWHLARAKNGSTLEQIQQSVFPYYTPRKTAKNIKRLLKTNLVNKQEVD